MSKRDCRRFTPDEDAYLEAHHAGTLLTHLARDLGRNETSVRHRLRWLADRGRADLGALAVYQPRWTPDQDAVLTEWYGRRPDGWIGRRIGRSADAVRVRAFTLRVRKSDHADWSANDIAVYFGVDVHKVTNRWIAQGFLTARRLRWPARRRWAITESAVRTFIRRYPTEYDPARLDPADEWGKLARKVHAADPWLTPTQVARLKGVSSDWVCRACRSGDLPAARTKGQGGHDVWKVRRSEARSWQARKPRRRPSYYPERRPFTAEEDAYVLGAWRRRVPWREIAARLGRSVTSASNRRRTLERQQWEATA